MSLHATLLHHLAYRAMSLAEMQIVSGVSLPTLRKVVQELLDGEWIEAVGQAQTTGGRPAGLFGLSAKRHVIIGVHLQLPGIRLLCSHLDGGILDAQTVFSSSTPAPGAALQAINDYVSRQKQTLAKYSVLGVGIATPGFTDDETGEILSVGRVTGWNNLPLCQQLQVSQQLPVSIINDIDAMALAEFRQQPGLQAQNHIYVGYDEGVKVSMFLSGQLYSGSFGNAGLISKTLFSPEHEDGDLLSLTGLSRYFLTALAELTASEQEAYAAISSEPNPRRQFGLIMQAATELPVCRVAVNRLTEQLARVVASVIWLLQPHTVYLGGALSSMSEASYQALELAIRRRLPGLLNKTIFQQARLGSENSAALGAARHFLATFVQSAAFDQASRKLTLSD